MKSRRELILALGAVPILAACGGEAAAPAKAEPTKAPAAAAPTTAASSARMWYGSKSLCL